MNKAAISVGIILMLLGFLHVFSNQKTDLSKAEEYYHQGEKLLEQFKLEEARAHFKKAIEEDMNFTQAHRSYIDVSLQMGEEFREELQEEYEAYLGAQQDNPVIYYALGRIYEDDEEKEKVFQKAIELDPDYPWGYFGMGYIHLMKKESEQAIACYEKAIESDPDEVLFYSSLARLLYDRHPDRHKQVEEIILKKFPDHFSAAMIVYQRASSIKDEAEKAAALEVYFKSYPDGPNASLALMRVLDFYKKNDSGKGEKIAREALSLPMTSEDKRSHKFAYLFLYQKAVDSKDMKEVEKICGEILASKNTDPSLYAQVADQLQKVKNFELAEKYYLKAIDMITPENVHGTMAHGRFPEEALADYCKQVANWYRSSLGKLYLEMNRAEEALAQFDQVEFKDPDSEYYLNLAKAYDQTGKKEKAYESLIESLILGANMEASEMLSQISEQLNKEEDAKAKIWEKRLEQAKPAVEFTLPDLEGNQVSLKDFRGKVVLINFWFPACGPCQMELPHIQKIHDKYKDQGLAVLLIQISQSQDDGKKFLEDHNYTMTSLYSEGNWASDNYGVKAAPTNLFIDRQGRIIFQSTGYSPGMEKEIESQIKELLEFEKK
jgi:tetratricopeptide (TPR) repeat protein